MRKHLLFPLALSAASGVFAQTRTLWPSDLCGLRAHADSEATADAAGIVAVNTGTGRDWPGATVFFKAGEKDLADYGTLRVAVRNTSGRPLDTGLVSTGSQTERADCYAAYVESCLTHPRFVGAHWFQWRDQALTGRGDGENYQIGFLTVTDQPYSELVEAARKIGTSMYRKRYGK